MPYEFIARGLLCFITIPFLLPSFFLLFSLSLSFLFLQIQASVGAVQKYKGPIDCIVKVKKKKKTSLTIRVIQDFLRAIQGSFAARNSYRFRFHFHAALIVSPFLLHWQTIREDGVSRGLFRGVTATLMREVPGNAAWFGVYENICRVSLGSASFEIGSITYGGRSVVQWACVYNFLFFCGRLAIFFFSFSTHGKA